MREELNIVGCKLVIMVAIQGKAWVQGNGWLLYIYLYMYRVCFSVDSDTWSRQIIDSSA